jgi:hypothetical protein
MRMNRKEIEPIYQVGDLLLKVRQDDYWFDHVIILSIDYTLSEYVYELFTSEGNVERRTVEWVQLNYRKEDETTTDYTEMD